MLLTKHHSGHCCQNIVVQLLFDINTAPLTVLCVVVAPSYLQMSAGQPEEDAITWGSDELPMEDMSRPDGERYALIGYHMFNQGYQKTEDQSEMSWGLFSRTGL